MTKFHTTTQNPVSVSYLDARCGVRYWEDGKVNGAEDTDGTLIPCREGDEWRLLINLETGRIEDWTQGVTASVHYKVCDDGTYALLDADRKIIKTIDGYVPKMLAPKGNGFGDYVIMDIDEGGVIQEWKVDLGYFEKGDE